VVLPLAATPVALTAPAFSARTTCKSATGILKSAPTVKALPGGAKMRTWRKHTGGTSLKAIQVVAVEIPPASSLRGAVYTAGSLSAHRTTAQQAAPHPKAVVVVNGGAFLTSGSGVQEGQMLGPAGMTKLQSTPTTTVSVLPDGRTGVAFLSVAGRVSGPGVAQKVTAVNWQSVPSGGVAVYTPQFGSARHPAGTVEVIVTSGTVTKVRSAGKRGKPVPAGKVAVTARGTAATQLRRLQSGSSLKVTYGTLSKWVQSPTMPPDRATPTTAAVDAGGYLVSGGVAQRGTCSSRDEELRPRTAIGWKADGTELVVTVSGRAVIDGVRYGGASTAQMGKYLRQLGAEQAVKLDGGGSTTMLVRKTAGGPLVRVDQAKNASQRPVVNTFSFELP
jgi:Phosphodiester glycosidase